MHWACINEHPSVVRLLLEYEANVNATTTAGATPLQLSVANRSQVPVQLLMNVDSQVWWLAVVVQDAVRSRGRPVCSLVGIQVMLHGIYTTPLDAQTTRNESKYPSTTKRIRPLQRLINTSNTFHQIIYGI